MLAVIASIAVGIAMFGTTVFLSQYMQVARGKSPTESGLLTIPMVVGLFLASTFIGRLVERTGRYKRFLLIGAVLLTAGLALMGTLDETTSLVELGAFMFVIGAGVGMLMQNLVLVVQNTVRFEDIGAGTPWSPSSAASAARSASACSARCSPTTRGADITSGLADAGHRRRPAPPTRCPTSPRCPAPVAHVIEHAYGTGVGEIFLTAAPLGLVALAAVALHARGAARRQERDRHRPRAGVHPRPPRSDLMSVATTPEPAAVLGELTLHRLLVADRRLGQRRAGPEGGGHRRPARQRHHHPDHRRPRPGRRPRRVVGPGRRDDRPGRPSTTTARKRMRSVLARIPADIAVHTLYRRGKPGRRSSRRPRRATTTRSSSAPAASAAWGR